MGLRMNEARNLQDLEDTYACMVSQYANEIKVVLLIEQINLGRLENSTGNCTWASYMCMDKTLQ